jgi:Ribbon-helix-helix protein, copG family
MMQDEREEYGEEARDIIEGLRRLARQVETPSDLAPQIRAGGERLWPSQPERRARWWAVVAAWRPPPLAWGPIVAAAFFIAGAFAPWPRVNRPLQEAVVEERSAPVTGLLPKESMETPPASPVTPSQQSKPEMRQQTDLAPAPPEGFSALARRAPHQISVSSQRPVTTTLPAALYEQLQQEAQRRQVSLTTIIREAVEAYTRSHKPED